jgi:hypothetical protein
VSNLSATARSTPDVKPEEFAVLARDVPRLSPNETIMDFVDSYFRALYFLQINGCDRLHIGTSTLES